MTDPHDTRPERDRTVIVNKDSGGGGGGGSGWLIAGLLIVVIVVGGYFLFGDRLTGGSAGGGDTNVTIDAPDINVPDVDVVPDGGNAAPAPAPAN